MRARLGVCRGIRIHPVPTQFESSFRVGLNSSGLPFKQGQAQFGAVLMQGLGAGTAQVEIYFALSVHRLAELRKFILAGHSDFEICQKPDHKANTSRGRRGCEQGK